MLTVEVLLKQGAMMVIHTEQKKDLLEKVLSTAISHKSSIVLTGFQFDETGRQLDSKWFCIDSTSVLSASIEPYKPPSNLVLAKQGTQVQQPGTIIR